MTWKAAPPPRPLEIRTNTSLRRAILSYRRMLAASRRALHRQATRARDHQRQLARDRDRHRAEIAELVATIDRLTANTYRGDRFEGTVRLRHPLADPSAPIRSIEAQPGPETRRAVERGEAPSALRAALRVDRDSFDALRRAWAAYYGKGWIES